MEAYHGNYAHPPEDHRVERYGIRRAIDAIKEQVSCLEVADRIASALEEEPGSLTRTEIINLFARNVGRDRIDQALALLEHFGRVRREVVQTGGRPAERWLLG